MDLRETEAEPESQAVPPVPKMTLEELAERLSKATPEELKGLEGLWRNYIRDVHQHKCANCGGTDRLVVKMIIPLEAGGKLVLSNGTLICRACEMAADSAANAKTSDRPRRPLNFWVSRPMYDHLVSGLQAHNGFGSMAALVRYLMSLYVTSMDRFDDLSNYQDTGTDVKINVWVDRGEYDKFKTSVNGRGMTVTDAIKSMILMYQTESETKVERTES